MTEYCDPDLMFITETKLDSIIYSSELLPKGYMAEYCDPDLMLITETKLDSIIYSSELLPKGYVGEFRRDRNLNGGGVSIVLYYPDLVLQGCTSHQKDTRHQD